MLSGQWTNNAKQVSASVLIGKGRQNFITSYFWRTWLNMHIVSLKMFLGLEADVIQLENGLDKLQVNDARPVCAM